MSDTSRASALHGLDTPLPLQPAQNYFQVAGWAFLPGAKKRCSVRVSVDQETFPAIETSERPDVAAQFPGEPSARESGFKIIGYLPFGVYLGTLEVSEDEKTWHRLRSLSIPVSSHPILGAIEKPSPDAVITRPIRIEGWCFHPEFELKEIVLQFGNVEVPCDLGLDRPDVAQRFPKHAAASRSGFITSENLPRGEGPVKIRALTTCGRVYFIRSEHRVAITEGWIPKPPPASPFKDNSTLKITRPSARRPGRGAGPLERGERNILFALYGDFSANSASHVVAFAIELKALGYDCVVAVPENKETVGALPRAPFVAIDFADLPDLSTCFRDGRGPSLLHAWTSRENVRRFAEEVRHQYACPVFVHLEDNERDILETRLGCPYSQLEALPDEELYRLVPAVLTHPRRGMEFLQSAVGVTIIIDRLKEHVPTGVPVRELWPSTDKTYFSPRPRDEAFRRRLGFKPRDVVLFYPGNTHTSNAGEMRTLYRAVAQLNREGTPTYLIRAGRDFPDFLPEGDEWIRPYLIHIGHMGRPKRMPELMAVADYFVQPGAPDKFNDYRFPSKLPEFFSIGRPVILPRSNVGLAVRHGEEAWLLGGSDAGAIVDAIVRLHSDPELVARLSRGSLAFSEKNFSWERTAARLLEFYRALTPLAAPPSS